MTDTGELGIANPDIKTSRGGGENKDNATDKGRGGGGGETKKYRSGEEGMVGVFQTETV